MQNSRIFKRITNFLFGAPTVESIVAPLAKIQDQLDDLVFDNAVEETANEALIKDLSDRNLALAKSSGEAIKIGDKFRKLLA